MNLRKALGPALAVLLLVGVGLAVRYSMQDKQAADAIAQRVRSHITVKVLTGS